MITVIGSSFSLPGQIRDLLERGTKQLDYEDKYGNTIEGAVLVGSHSKGLSNNTSDYDIKFYYSLSKEALLAMSGKSFVVPDEFLHLDDLPFELEITWNPLMTVTQEAGKQLLRNIQKQNGMTLVDTTRGIVLLRSRLFADLRTILINDFKWDPNSILGYTRGYMTAQIHTNRRKSEFTRRMDKAVNDKDLYPVAKVVCEGVQIGLTGVSLLEKLTMYRDFKTLFDEYRKLFDPEDAEFIDICHKMKKREYDRWDIQFRPFITKAEEVRGRIFHAIVNKMDMLDDQYYREMRDLEPADKRKNNKLIDDFVYDMYLNNKYW